MKIRKTYHTIDTHTGGEPTRTVVGGVLNIPGATMKDKMVYMMQHGDHVRQTLTYEPRGNEVMSGTLIMPPCNPGADVGVLFFEVGGWMPMCGHDTIGVCTALVEAGLIEVEEPVTYVTLDTAAGLVKVKIDVKDCVAKRVTFTNAPAFVLAANQTVRTREFGDVMVDIAYGGNIYAILPAESVGLTLDADNGKKIVATGNLLKSYINEQIHIRHPELSFMDTVTHIEFSAAPHASEADIRNAVVIPPGAIDRSPCGTGTSAKMALLASKGQLKEGDSFVHESLIGSLFYCRIVGTTNVAGIPAIIPEVSGSAWVTGIHTFMIDPEDPFPLGFYLK